MIEHQASAENTRDACPRASLFFYDNTAALYNLSFSTFLRTKLHISKQNDGGYQTMTHLAVLPQHRHVTNGRNSDRRTSYDSIGLL